MFFDKTGHKNVEAEYLCPKKNQVKAYITATFWKKFGRSPESLGTDLDELVQNAELVDKKIKDVEDELNDIWNDALYNFGN
jgi:hypothetical protein